MGKGFKSIGRILGAILLGHIFHALVPGMSWLRGALLGASLLFKPKPPKSPELESTPDSQTYSFDGISTQASADLPIPLVFGRHAVGGNILNSYISTNNVVTTSRKTFTDAGTKMTDSGPMPGTVIGDRIFYQEYTFDNLGDTTELDVVVAIQLKRDWSTFVDGNQPRLWYNYEVNANDYVRVFVQSESETFPRYMGMIDLSASGYSTQVWNSYAGFREHELTLKLKAGDTSHVLRLEYVPVSYYDTYGGKFYSLSRLEQTTSGDHVWVNKYIAEYTVQGGTGGGSQTLVMDVGLSVGEIDKLHKVWFNDQEIANFAQYNSKGEKIPLYKYRMRNGFRPYVGMNRESQDITIQSFIANTNANIEALNYSTVGDANNTEAWVVVDDHTLWNDDLNPANASSINIGYPVPDTYYVGSKDGTNPNKMYIYYKTSPTTGVPAVGHGFTNWIGKVAYSSDMTYRDFIYSTQSDYVDALDLAINFQNGLYGVNQETGGLYAIEATYKIWIAHQLVVGTADPDDGNSISNWAGKEIICTGAKRNKQFYNLNIPAEQLPSDSDGGRKYKIRVRKLTLDSNNEYIVNAGLNCAFVEEVKNKEMFYNGVSYATVKLQANSKINTSAPNMLFEMNGLLVPTPLPDSLVIDTANSTQNIIRLKFNPDWTTAGRHNYNNVSDLNTLYCNTANGNHYSLPPDRNIFPVGTYPNLLFGRPCYFGEDDHIMYRVFHAYFKCGEDWHERYVTMGQQFVGTDQNDPEHYVTEFVISYVHTLYGNGFPQDSNYIQNMNDILPSVPTDMVLYLWDDNPATSLLFLLIDKEEGLGIDLSQIDLDSFKAGYLHFNEAVENPLIANTYMKRCQLNYVIDTIDDVRNHLAKILSTCHAAIYPVGDKVKLLLDAKVGAGDILVHLDHYADIVGSINIATVPKKEAANQVTIKYLDAAQQYKQETIVVEDPSLSRSNGYDDLNAITIDLYGITDAAHCFYEGLQMIKKAKYTKFVISFNTALSGLPLEVFDVFTLTSDIYGWTDKKFRCVGVKTNENLETTIDAIEYYDAIYEISPEDSVQYQDIRHTDLPDPNQAPSALRDLTIFEENFKNTDGSVTIDLVGHVNLPNEGADFDGTDLVKLPKYEYAKTAGMLVDLYEVDDALGTNPVQLKKGISFSGTELRFKDVSPGFYYVIAYSVSIKGVIGAELASSVLELTGKIAPPDDVASLTITQQPYAYSKKNEYLITWDGVADFDVGGYRVTFGTSTLVWTDADNLFNTVKYVPGAPGESHSILVALDSALEGATFKAMIKAYDTSGNYSINVTESSPIVIDLKPSAPTSLLVTMPDPNDFPLKLTWDNTTDYPMTSISHRVKLGDAASTWETAEELVVTKQDTFLTIPYEMVTLLDAYNGTAKIYVASIWTDFADLEGDPAVYSFTLNTAPAVPTIGTPYYNSTDRTKIVIPYTLPADLDLFGVECRIGLTSDTWETASIYAALRRKSYIATAEIDMQGYASQTYRLFFKSYDNAGNYSVSPVTLDYAFDFRPQTPTNVTLTSLNGDGNFPVKVTWDAVSTSLIDYYVILLVEGTEDWDTAVNPYRATHMGTSLIIYNADEKKSFVGNLKAIVNPVDVYGLGALTKGESGLLAFSAVPAAPATITPSNVGTGDKDLYHISWAASTSDDYDGYLLKIGTAAETWATASVLSVATDRNTTEYYYRFAASGSYKIFVKSVDIDGNESTTAQETVLVVDVAPAAPSNVQITTPLGPDDFPVTVTWDRVTNDAILGYNVRLGNATSVWATAYDAGKTGGVSLYVRNVSQLADDTSGTLKAFVQTVDRNHNVSTTEGIGSTAFTPLPAAPTNLELVYNEFTGLVGLKFEKAVLENDLAGFQVAYGTDPDPANNTKRYIGKQFSVELFTVANTMDGVLWYYSVRSYDSRGKYSTWTTINQTLDVVPAAILAANVTIVPGENSLSISLPDKNTEESFYKYEIHLSTTSGFTPSAATVAATTADPTFTIDLEPDGTLIEDSTPYYLRIRALGKIGKGANDNFNSAYTDQVTATTIDATAPTIFIESTTPSIDPINIINSASLSVDYFVDDNISVDRTVGRVFRSGTTPPAWTDPISDPEAFSLGIDDTYVLQLKVYDTAGNSNTVVAYFDKDTAVASAPSAVVAEPLSTVSSPEGTQSAVLITITNTQPNHFKDYVLEYAVSTNGGVDWSAWGTLRTTTSKTIVESIAFTGLIKYRVKVTKIHDAALDSAWTESNTVIVDSVPPNVFIDSASPDIFTNQLLPAGQSTLDINFTAEDSGGLGTDCASYSLDGGAYTPVTTTGTAYSRTGTVGLTGLPTNDTSTHYVIIKIVDKVGNDAYTNPIYFKLDNVAVAAPDTPVLVASGRTVTVTI